MGDGREMSEGLQDESNMAEVRQDWADEVLPPMGPGPFWSTCARLLLVPPARSQLFVRGT